MPTTKSDKDAVREELERLLAHPYFSQSKRYPQFLRHVVGHTLAGDDSVVKERVLGIEIFGRTPDYDTGTDPVVRVTATEIRKRLILYYQQPEHQQGIRIILPAGSYSPRFQLPDEVHDAKPDNAVPIEEPAEAMHEEAPLLLTVAAEEPVAEQPAGAVAEPAASATARRFPHWWMIAACALVLLVGAAYAVRRGMQPPPQQGFWAPMMGSTDPVLICIPDQMNDSQLVLWDASNPKKPTTVPVRRSEVAMTDLPPLLNIVAALDQHKRPFHIKGSAVTGLDDLRQSDAILIGSFNNPWTLRFTQTLRFHFANDADVKRLRIEDREHPESAAWTRDTSRLYQDTYYEDYSILARFLNPDTGRYVVMVAGLGHGATLATGAFLASDEDTAALMRLAPAGWKGQGMEAVLKTSVAGDEAGAPHVVATYFW
ncbi:hypothetical protein ACFQBQ_13100 [Granulicella cerasi]|uniref:Uncharacterized protein n=1 Tax=Granulicella cerasi TaxID=741063 RepID=A0ABW1ZCX3_9BACT